MCAENFLGGGNSTWKEIEVRKKNQWPWSLVSKRENDRRGRWRDRQTWEHIDSWTFLGKKFELSLKVKENILKGFKYKNRLLLSREDLGDRESLGYRYRKRVFSLSVTILSFELLFDHGEWQLQNLADPVWTLSWENGYLNCMLLFLFSWLVRSNSLQPHGLQHARLPCPSLSPRVCSKSCPLSRWCHPTISSSVIPFSSCPHPFPASASFQ